VADTNSEARARGFVRRTLGHTKRSTFEPFGTKRSTFKPPSRGWALSGRRPPRRTAPEGLGLSPWTSACSGQGEPGTRDRDAGTGASRKAYAGTRDSSDGLRIPR